MIHRERVPDAFFEPVRIPFPADGGSDADVFNASGAPSVVLGAGMATGHTLDEFIREEHPDHQTGELVLTLIKTTAAQGRNAEDTLGG